MVFKIIVKESRGSNILPENCISVTKTYVQFGSMYNAFFKDYSFIEVFKDEENFLIAFLPSANGDKGFSKRGGKRCTLSSRVSSHILNGRYVPSEMTNENGDKMLVIKTQKTI